MREMRDLTGMRFGRLVAIEAAGRRRRSSIVWRCRCDCGREVEVSSEMLTRGITMSCGCLQRESRMADITGRRCGQLVAIRPTGEIRDGGAVWIWRCDCGREVERTTAQCQVIRVCDRCAREIKRQQAYDMQARREKLVDPATGLTPGQREALETGKLTAQNTSGVRGVTWHRGMGMWQVRVFKGGKVWRTRYARTLEEAKALREELLRLRLEE